MAFFWNKKKTKEESDKEKESLDSGLGKTKRSFFEKIQRAIAGKTTIDDDVLDGIEEALVASDIGVDTTLKIIDLLEDRVARDKYMNTSELHRILKEEMVKLLDIKDDVAHVFLNSGNGIKLVFHARDFDRRNSVSFK